MDLVVRVPDAADASHIAALHVETWRETYTHLLPDGFFDAAHVRMRDEMWERILGGPRDDWTVRVVEADGRLLGFAMAGPSTGTEDDPAPRERQLYSIYVSASAHGTGAGQALLDAVLDGVPAMLWVAKENPRAIAFYIRNGFAFDGVEQQDPGAPRIIDVRMVR